MDIQQVSQKKTWITLLKNHPQHSFMQSWEWGQFKSDKKTSVFYFTNTEKSLLASCLLSKIPNTNYFKLYIPFGPLYSNDSDFDDFLQFLTLFAKQQICLFIDIEPQSIINKKILTQNNYIPQKTSIQPKKTTVLDLYLDE